MGESRCQLDNSILTFWQVVLIVCLFIPLPSGSDVSDYMWPISTHIAVGLFFVLIEPQHNNAESATRASIPLSYSSSSPSSVQYGIFPEMPLRLFYLTSAMRLGVLRVSSSAVRVTGIRQGLNAYEQMN